jgi:hypothetical protein
MKLEHDNRSITIDGQTWPAQVDDEDSEVPNMTPWHVRGARVIFENGWLVSIVWGSGTYSDNYHHTLHTSAGIEFIEEPEVVEIAVWNDRIRDKNGHAKMIEWPDGDTVRGFTPVEGLPELFPIIEKAPSNGSTYADLP